MRRKIHISYRKEEIPDDLEIDYDWGPLSSIPVPQIEHLRSNYLHRLNVLSEQLIDESFFKKRDISGINIEYLNKINQSIFDFVFENRLKLSPEHKILYWIVRVRLNLLITKMSGQWNDFMGNIDKIKGIEALNLMISDRPIYRYTLSQFWRTLKLLLSKFNSLRWSNELEYYISCLKLCCGKFFIIQEPVNVIKYLDFRLFFEVNDGERRITLNFIKETERIFFGFEKRLRIYHLTSRYKSVAVNYDPAQMQIVHNWLEPLISNVYLDPLKKAFSKIVFHLDVLIGEKERYIEEEKFGEPTVQNIIAKWRVDHIDQLRSMAQRDSIIELLKKIVKTKRTPPLVNIQLNEMLRIMIDYKLDSLFAVNRLFSSQYAVPRKAIKWRVNKNETEAPLIFREFNDYSVFFQDTIYKCRTYADCFVTWVKLLCENTKCKGIFPNQRPEVNLVDLYKSLFPEFNNSHQILDFNLANLQGLNQLPPMKMPDFYN